MFLHSTVFNMSTLINSTVDWVAKFTLSSYQISEVKLKFYTDEISSLLDCTVDHVLGKNVLKPYEYMVHSKMNLFLNSRRSYWWGEVTNSFLIRDLKI